MNVLALHRDLVAFPSLSHEEGPIADYVERLLKVAGLPVQRHDHNVWTSLGSGDNRLLLNSHLDVVPPSEGHPYPPFQPTVVDGKVYGRGTVDAKGSGAAMLAALIELSKEGYQPPGGQVLLALTACEEVGRGYNGLETIRPMLPPLSAALVGEPTSLEPCFAQKGLLILKGIAHGRSAHAARAHLGDNAVMRAVQDLQTLAAHPFDKADPYLGKPTLTVTRIEGGSANNVVPDRCTFFLDVRTTPAYTHEELTEQLRGLVDSELVVHSDRLVPVRTDPQSAIARACLAVLPEAIPFGSPTMSDWLFLRDLPVVKIGPGRSEVSHTPDEHLAEADLLRAVGVYKRIIRMYFAG